MQHANPKRSAIIVAGGKGERAGCDLPKQFCEIGGKPMLMHSIEAFHRFDADMQIILVLPQSCLDLWYELRLQYSFHIPITIAFGGETRFHSVKSGLENVADTNIVAVHDAARPFVPQSVIARCYDAAFKTQCGIVPVVGVRDTIRIVANGGNSELLDRSSIRLVQTPQVFFADVLKNAYNTDYSDSFTDDASVAEKAGVDICLIEGDDRNIKLTTPFDMQIGHAYLSAGK